MHKPSREDLVTLRDLIEKAAFTPVPDTTYPLAKAAEAVQHVREGHPEARPFSPSATPPPGLSRTAARVLSATGPLRPCTA